MGILLRHLAFDGSDDEGRAALEQDLAANGTFTERETGVVVAAAYPVLGGALPSGRFRTAVQSLAEKYIVGADALPREEIVELAHECVLTYRQLADDLGESAQRAWFEAVLLA